MLPVQFTGSEKLNVLLIGAHCDDIEIGCGGTVLRLIKEGKIEHISWIVFTSTDERKQEALKSAEHFLKNVESKHVSIYSFADTILAESKTEIKDILQSLKTNHRVDLIFTHHSNDLHQDHKILNQLTWNVFRNHFILEYEIAKYDGDLGQPNFFVTLNEELVSKKIESLLRYYLSQMQKHWFDRETFQSLLRIRGLECASPTRYAEGFHAKKINY